MKGIALRSLTVFVIGFMIAGESYSHEEVRLPEEGLRVSATLAPTYRSMQLVEKNERWIVPGFLMGGEAYPMPKGFSMDELFLAGTYSENDVYAYLKVGQHAGGSELEVEHALVGVRALGDTLLEAGHMSGDFSPFNKVHASATPYADSLLLYDTLWGRQYNDSGVRIRAPLLKSGVDLGFEYWQGGSFPSRRAKTSEGAYDLFIDYAWSHEDTRVRLGSFYYRGYAIGRKDDRYSSSHSHSEADVVFPIYYFDGKSDVIGVSGRIEFKIAATVLTGEGEYQIATSEGKLRDATRESPIETRYRAYWWGVSARREQNLIGLRYERLAFTNDIEGPSAAALVDLAGLKGNKDPYRISVAYNYLTKSALTLKAEWMRDLSTRRKIDSATLGLVWFKDVMLSGDHEAL